MEDKQFDYFYLTGKDNLICIYMISLIKASEGGIDFVVFVFWQLIMVFVFAFAYWILTHANRCPEGNNCEFYGLGSHSSLMDFFYYSLTTQTTVGFGDIVPMSKMARILSILQMTMIYLGIGITEAKILHVLRRKEVWQPGIVLLALLVAAFAPPIISVVAAVFTKGKTAAKRINASTQRFVKIPSAIRHQV